MKLGSVINWLSGLCLSDNLCRLFTSLLLICGQRLAAFAIHITAFTIIAWDDCLGWLYALFEFKFHSRAQSMLCYANSKRQPGQQVIKNAKNFLYMHWCRYTKSEIQKALNVKSQ